MDSMTAQSSPLIREVEAALDWWSLSGVDCDFRDDATDWLAQEAAAATASPALKREAASSASVRGPDDKLPDVAAKRADLFDGTKPETLTDFHRWWLEAPGLDAIGPRGRIAPRGSEGAVLMVLVVHPEEQDREALLGGSQGRLLANILTAMGLTPDQTYIASALPRHTPMADTEAIAAGGMDTVVSHHIELASPQRLLALGTDLLPLLGLDAKDQEGALRAVDGTWRSTPMLISEGLDAMMAMPMLKGRFWRRWIEWSQGS